MMINQHKAIAQTHRDGQLFKTRLLSLAQRILIVVSAMMMSFSVLFYMITDWTLSWNIVVECVIYFVIPLLIACCIEALIILSSHAINGNRRNGLAWMTLIFGTIVSGLAGELFFGKMAESQNVFVWLVFHAFGILVPIMQIMYELNQDNIKSFILQTVDTETIDIGILDMQTKANIVKLRFDSMQKAMNDPEVQRQIDARSNAIVIDQVSKLDHEAIGTIVSEVNEPSASVLEALRGMQEKLSQLEQQQPKMLDAPKNNALEQALLELRTIASKQAETLDEVTQRLSRLEKTPVTFPRADERTETNLMSRDTEQLPFVPHQVLRHASTRGDIDAVTSKVDNAHEKNVTKAETNSINGTKQSPWDIWAQSLPDEELERHLGPKGKKLRIAKSEEFGCSDRTIARAVDDEYDTRRFAS